MLKLIMNLAHMRAVKIYREMGLDGKIGAVIDLFPFYPYDLTDEKDFYAADRRFDFYAGKWLVAGVDWKSLQPLYKWGCGGNGKYITPTKDL